MSPPLSGTEASGRSADLAEMLLKVLISISSLPRSHNRPWVYIGLQGKPGSVIVNSLLVSAGRANIGCKAGSNLFQDYNSVPGELSFLGLTFLSWFFC